jgi:tetratricopeptide (TPR) repeat protein
MQDFERAAEFDRRGTEIAKGSLFLEVLAHSLINLGYDYRGQSRQQESLLSLKKAEEARDADPWMRWRHNIRLQAGEAESWLAAGDMAQAESYARELLKVATQHGDRKYHALARQILGQVYCSEQRWAEAESEFQAAVTLLEQYPAPLLGWKVYAALGRLYLETGKNELASQAFNDAALIINELAANTEQEDLRETFLNSAAVREVIEKAA